MKALDDAWITELVKAAGVAPHPYFVLGPSGTPLRELFDTFEDAGYKTNPDLRPTKETLAEARVEESLRSLHELRAAVTLREEHPGIQHAYTTRIDELIASLDLLKAASNGDIGAFRERNAQIYGAPNPAVFATAKAILDGDTRATLAPDPETYRQAWELHNGDGGYFSQLFDGVDIPAGRIDQYAGDELLRALLKNLEASSYTIMDSPDRYWGLNHTDKLLFRPKWYNMTREEFLGIVGHEIGSHLLERLNGDKQPLKLLGFGLAGYEQYNEGRALIREQVAYPTWEAFAESDRWHEILCRHVAIGLGVGLDGKPWNFAEVYAYILDKYSRRLSYEEQAHRPAWNLVSRCLSGTDGNGGAYYKDIVYLEGNLRCWELAKQDPTIVMQGDIGKYNHANPDQVDLLTKLQILS